MACRRLYAGSELSVLTALEAFHRPWNASYATSQIILQPAAGSLIVRLVFLDAVLREWVRLLSIQHLRTILNMLLTRTASGSRPSCI